MKKEEICTISPTDTQSETESNIKNLPFSVRVFDIKSCRKVLLFLSVKAVIVCRFCSCHTISFCIGSVTALTNTKIPESLFPFYCCCNTVFFGMVQRNFTLTSVQRDLNLTWTQTLNELVQSAFKRIIHLIFLHLHRTNDLC